MVKSKVEADEEEEVEEHEHEHVLVVGHADEGREYEVHEAVVDIHAHHDDGQVVREGLRVVDGGENMADHPLGGEQVEDAESQAEDDEQQLLAIVLVVSDAHTGREVAHRFVQRYESQVELQVGCIYHVKWFFIILQTPFLVVERDVDAREGV